MIQKGETGSMEGRKGSLAVFCRIFEWFGCNYFVLGDFLALLLIVTLHFQAKHQNGKRLYFTAHKNG
jgi:hypothetical protein